MYVRMGPSPSLEVILPSNALNLDVCVCEQPASGQLIEDAQTF